MVILHTSFWLSLILIVAMSSIPVLGELIRAGLYIYAFIDTVSKPIGVISIIFFIFFGLYVFSTVLPFMRSFLSALFGSNE